MSPRHLIPLLLVPIGLLLACGEGDPKDDTAPPEGDTDTDTDADTDTDTDTDTDVTTVNFIIPKSAQSQAFALYGLSLADNSIGAPEPGVAVSGGTAQIDLGALDISGLETFDPELPDLAAKAWVTSVIRDSDGDLALSADEYFLSLASAALLYLEGTPSEAMAKAGYQEGWNVRGFNVLAGIDDVASWPLSEVIITPNLSPAQKLQLAGEDRLGLDPSTLGLVMTAPSDLLDGAPYTTVIDEALGSDGKSWSVLVEVAAPDEHRGLSGFDEDAAVEGLYIYTMGDSESFDDSESIVGVACRGPDQAMAVHLPPASDLDTALHYLGSNLRPGWSLYLRSKSEGLRPADAETYEQVNLAAGGCRSSS